MSQSRMEKISKRLTMIPKKTKKDEYEYVEEGESQKGPSKANLKRDRGSLVSARARHPPRTPQEVADYSGDEGADPVAMERQKMAKKNKLKDGKDVAEGPVNLVKREQLNTGYSDDGDDESDEEDATEEGDSKAEEYDNMATCFFRDIWCEHTKYTFVYLKRKGKCVNVNINCLPWLIQKLCYYYSIRGNDLPKALNAVNEGRNRLLQAVRELNENQDLVKETAKAA